MNLTEIKNKIIELEKEYGNKEIYMPTLDDSAPKIVKIK